MTLSAVQCHSNRCREIDFARAEQERELFNPRSIDHKRVAVAGRCNDCRLAESRALIDYKPMVTIIDIRAIGNPLQHIRQWVSRILAFERLDAIKLSGQPVEIMASVLDDREFEVNLGFVEDLDKRFY